MSTTKASEWLPQRSYEAGPPSSHIRRLKDPAGHRPHETGVRDHIRPTPGPPGSTVD